MAFLNETFNAADLPQSEQGNFEPLPAGWYTVKIAGAELKTTKNGSGQYIAVRYDVLAPTHQGRVVFGNLNIRNQNPKAEEIGRQQLGDLMRAIGLASVQDTDQLIGGTLAIKLAIRAQEGYEPSNDVKAFKAVGGAAPATPAQTPQQQTPPSTSPPWARK